MALFANQCRFNCGKTFATLGELIYHIEEIHIDYDPQIIEQKEKSQPTCLPLSYVLRFVTEAARIQNQSNLRESIHQQQQQPQQAQTPTSPSIESPVTPTSTPKVHGSAILGNNIGTNTSNTIISSNNNSNGSEIKRKLAITHHSYSLSSSNRSNTPTGSEAMSDDDQMLSESEDSNDSWTTEEFSSEFIMKYGVKHSAANGLGTNEKPYVCPVPGCKKRYKNVNGIKYHSKNGHKKDGNGIFNCRVRKGYKCQCGKSYKTATGLKRHAMITSHSSQNMAEGSNNNSGSNGSSGSSSGNNLLGLSSTTAMKNTMNLVTIKTKPSLVSISSANKLVKFVSDNVVGSKSTSSNASSPSSSIVQSPSSGNNNNSKLDNLGILTPATSPKQQAGQQTCAASTITGSNASSPNNDTDTDTENCSSGKTNYDET
uniref:CSON002344 protein n=1 Tax=Culicoides sonorensis TaxID=179676 RepID=A0A336MIV2_CULSO